MTAVMSYCMAITRTPDVNMRNTTYPSKQNTKCSPHYSCIPKHKQLQIC